VPQGIWPGVKSSQPSSPAKGNLPLVVRGPSCQLKLFEFDPKSVDVVLDGKPWSS